MGRICGHFYFPRFIRLYPKVCECRHHLDRLKCTIKGHWLKRTSTLGCCICSPLKLDHVTTGVMEKLPMDGIKECKCIVVILRDFQCIVWVGSFSWPLYKDDPHLVNKNPDILVITQECNFSSVTIGANSDGKKVKHGVLSMVEAWLCTGNERVLRIKTAWWNNIYIQVFQCFPYIYAFTCLCVGLYWT